MVKGMNFRVCDQDIDTQLYLNFKEIINIFSISCSKCYIKKILILKHFCLFEIKMYIDVLQLIWQL